MTITIYAAAYEIRMIFVENLQRAGLVNGSEASHLVGDFKLDIRQVFGVVDLGNLQTNGMLSLADSGFPLQCLFAVCQFA
jgi:hypothetical protein